MVDALGLARTRGRARFGASVGRCEQRGGRRESGAPPAVGLPLWPNVIVCHRFSARRQQGYGDYTAKKKAGVNSFAKIWCRATAVFARTGRSVDELTNLFGELIKISQETNGNKAPCEIGMSFSYPYRTAKSMEYRYALMVGAVEKAASRWAGAGAGTWARDFDMNNIVIAAALAFGMAGAASAEVIELGDQRVAPLALLRAVPAAGLGAIKLGDVAVAARSPAEPMFIAPAAFMSELPEPDVILMMLLGLVLIGYRAGRDSSEKFK